ncbi:MAG TPA: hypothetical protein VFM60_01730, partial [Salinimicrobium sp.]|nr:hypothetical protein [Salinimicrobium sp.]
MIPIDGYKIGGARSGGKSPSHNCPVRAHGKNMVLNQVYEMTIRHCTYLLTAGPEAFQKAIRS